MDVLTDRHLISYDRLSRYSTVPAYFHLQDEKYTYGTTHHLEDNTSYQNYKVKKGDTLDKIALEAWNNPTLYWVIADFNKIIDPFVDLPEGYVIKIPVLSNIEFRS